MKPSLKSYQLPGKVEKLEVFDLTIVKKLSIFRPHIGLEK